MTVRLSVAVRKRLGKRSAVEIEAELRRMQVARSEGKPFDSKVYGFLKRELRRIDQIAVANGGVARQSLDDHDDWLRCRRERQAAKANGRRINGTPLKDNPRTFCEVKHEVSQNA